MIAEHNNAELNPATHATVTAATQLGGNVRERGCDGKEGVSAQGEGPTLLRLGSTGKGRVKALVYVLGSVDGACVGAGEGTPL